MRRLQRGKPRRRRYGARVFPTRLTMVGQSRAQAKQRLAISDYLYLRLVAARLREMAKELERIIRL